ncbi:xanthine dehydrogenase family protein molybdopterin-binding subunit [Pelagovum pacificum]|uniref:Xanthine dehydrogenase family protein molybdopterin-binding subunit n=1 Tax=Pelagovum pacificum TaxID=2588711 RepID=A0A5C5G844_9RHOB|nr:molybdopterin cofactor-binding domain-containing protein [Pelagovum pacificum]QQA41600.1 xanthine dehydrogenase family protein molybdopterin-binding subunit [Pelagovum pacificum]TNY30879.1 xanthine dehydrogenase family protein molybdopterin-binding subunit [Pelagovum pacificum]
MSRAGRIARRTVLFGSAAIVGGVAFGIWKVRTPYPNPLEDGLDVGHAALSPWVKITGDEIVLITPHTDLGQGAYQMQAALIAEELDLDPGQYRTEPGEPAPAYYNTAAGADVAPFRSSDTRLRAEATRSVLASFTKLLGMMVTGGSSSVPDSFDKLRLAGATARETLKRAAAEETGLPVSELRTASGAVVLPDGTALPYTELAATAATLDVVEEVTLRDPSQWRLIGQPMQRLDIVAKSTGTQVYGIDIAPEGVVHAAIRLNPRRGGAMERFDATAAREMPGVIEVMEVTGGIAVVADNTWRAFRAADAVEIDWGPAPYPAEMEAHWQRVADSFTDDFLDSEWRHDGDADAALDGADVIEAEYRAPYVAHQPLEPLSAVVLVTDGGVDIWVAHQFQSYVAEKVAGITGHAAEDVRYHQQYAGGSFGHRLEWDNVGLAVEIANRMRGTPVKLTYRREEDFAQDYPRQIGMARGRGSVRNGQVETYDLQVATVSALRSQFSRLGQSVPGPDMQIAAGAWDQPFAVPNFRMRAYAVPELAPVSSWRSVGASSQGFFASAFLDELIFEAGADPLAERLRLCDYDLARGVLEAVGEMSDWGSDPGEGRGRGISYVESFGVPVAEVVDVTATPVGIRIDKVFVAVDVGTVVDPVNFENQVQGGVVWGLGHAMNCEITYSDGMAQQRNYHAHAGMRLYQCPSIEVRNVGRATSVRGVGEPPVPPAAPALAGAIFAATGQRLREMPFDKFVTFV